MEALPFIQATLAGSPYYSLLTGYRQMEAAS